MWRLALLSAFAVLGLAGCKHKSSSTHVKENSTHVVAASVSALKMSDPEADQQLIKGFYGLESGSWRWTAPKFALVLRPPEGSAQSGATLEFKFSLPVAVTNVGPLTLSASANGIPLRSQTYSKPGDSIYTTPVPPEGLKGESITVEFSTDKAVPPVSGDRRELALIAVSVALLPK